MSHVEPESDHIADTDTDEELSDTETSLAVVSSRPIGHRRAKKKRRGIGCVITLLILAVLGVAGYWGVNKVSAKLDEMFGPPADYTGNGQGSVVVEVAQGDPVSEIGRTLKDEGVVASVEAFTEEAARNPESRTIQAGYYKMAKKMSAEAALGRLLDSHFRTSGGIVVPEGARSDQVIEAIADGSEISKSDATKALQNPEKLRLPSYANGEPEGFLFAATYEVRKDQSALGVLRAMVRNASNAHRSVGLQSKAAQLGMTPREVLTVASLIEKEVSRDADRPKVARVIYNRLEAGQALELDSTVHYANESSGDVFTNEDARNIDSPYNTYKHTGLPPGPIDTPGKESLKAAVNPAEGDWTYFVTVNLDSGKTEFSSSLSEHNNNVEKLRDYCEGSDQC